MPVFLRFPLGATQQKAGIMAKSIKKRQPTDKDKIIAEQLVKQRYPDFVLFQRKWHKL